MTFFVTAFGSDAHAQGETRLKRRYVVVESTYENVGEARPNAFSVELLGRGLLYGLAYDRQLTDWLALGVGYTSADSGSGADSSRVSWTMIPVYGNFYFTPNNHRGFLTAGLNFISVEAQFTERTVSRETFGVETTSTNARGSAAFAVVGGGYEFRGDGGFLFRASLYQMLLGAAGSLTWFGLGFGVAF